MRVAALVLAVVAGALPACGKKNYPVAPELVRPELPENLTAVSTPEGVRLGWLRPLRYSGGGKMNDLDGFQIERAPGDGAAPVFGKVGTLTLEDQDRFRKERHLEWTDKSAEPGARYLYRVSAFTLDGYWSPPAGPVAVRFGLPAAAPASPPQ